MTRALVTGGAGFLGSHVADELLRMGLEVAVLDDLSGGFRCNVPATCAFHRGSIEDESMVEALFAQHRFDYVYHLAAYAAEGLSHFIRGFNYRTNLLGSVNLINAAVRHGTQCFVFTSSIAVYGGSRPPFREEDAGTPCDPYGVSKLAVEQDLACARRTFGLRRIVFRPHNVYGERQNLADPYRNVVGIFVRETLSGRPCTVFGDGRQTRAFSYVGDVAPVIARSVLTPEASDETFNIGADEPVSILELAELVQNALGVRVGIQHVPARMEQREVYADHTKLRRVLAPSPCMPLEEGLRRVGAWARGLELRSPRPVARVELTRNLPPSWAALLAPDPEKKE